MKFSNKTLSISKHDRFRENTRQTILECCLSWLEPHSVVHILRMCPVAVIACADLHYSLHHEARNDCTNNSETILLCNRCACNWKMNSQIILVCIGVHRKYLVEAPKLHESFPARKSCVTDVLCNGETDSTVQYKRCLCNNFRPELKKPGTPKTIVSASNAKVDRGWHVASVHRVIGLDAKCAILRCHSFGAEKAGRGVVRPAKRSLL